jgi:MFS family permease
MALFGIALGALFTMPLAGWCAARLGSHWVTQVVAIAYCLTLPFLALAPNASLLTVALFCFGAFDGAFDVAMNAQAVAMEERYQQPIMSSFHALWSVGGLSGAALGALAAIALASNLGGASDES